MLPAINTDLARQRTKLISFIFDHLPDGCEIAAVEMFGERTTGRTTTAYLRLRNPRLHHLAIVALQGQVFIPYGASRGYPLQACPARRSIESLETTRASRRQQRRLRRQLAQQRTAADSPMRQLSMEEAEPAVPTRTPGGGSTSAAPTVVSAATSPIHDSFADRQTGLLQFDRDVAGEATLMYGAELPVPFDRNDLARAAFQFFQTLAQHGMSTPSDVRGSVSNLAHPRPNKP